MVPRSMMNSFMQKNDSAITQESVLLIFILQLSQWEADR